MSLHKYYPLQTILCLGVFIDEEIVHALCSLMSHLQLHCCLDLNSTLVSQLCSVLLAPSPWAFITGQAETVLFLEHYVSWHTQFAGLHWLLSSWSNSITPCSTHACWVTCFVSKGHAYSCVNRVLKFYILLNGGLTSIWEHAVQKLMSFSSVCTTTKRSISSFCFCRAKYSIFSNERWNRSYVMHRMLPLVTKPRLHNIHIRGVCS